MEIGCYIDRENVSTHACIVLLSLLVISIAVLSLYSQALDGLALKDIQEQLLSGNLPKGNNDGLHHFVKQLFSDILVPVPVLAGLTSLYKRWGGGGGESRGAICTAGRA